MIRYSQLEYFLPRSSVSFVFGVGHDSVVAELIDISKLREFRTKQQNQAQSTLANYQKHLLLGLN
jgi:hypothetical protein